MTFRSYRDESRIDWGTRDEGGFSLDQVNAGALLRIADAVEKMANNYDVMQRDRDFWKESALSAERSLDTEHRRTAALRGWIKRMRATR